MQVNALLEESPGPASIIVAETDSTLLEIPAAYPTWAWEGTAYAEFAKECTRENFVPPEFFIEALKTVVGGAAGHLLGIQGSDVEARFYTVLIGGPGTGKSTAISWALSALPSSLVYTYGKPLWPTLGCFVGGFGSQVGLIRKAKEHEQILQCYDEFSTLADKFKITGSGLSFLSLINALYEETMPPCNITKDEVCEVREPLHNSILGATTPDVWERTFGGTGSEGSGFFQRLNIIGSEETRTVARLKKPDLSQFAPLADKMKCLLDEKRYRLPMNDAADRLLQEWQTAIMKNAHDDAGRLQVLALRNAGHLGWLLNVRAGKLNSTPPEEVIRRAIAISNFQLGMRQKYRPVVGDTPWAQMENLIKRCVQQHGSITRKLLYRKVHADRQGIIVFSKALENLEREGFITRQKIGEGTRWRTELIVWNGPQK